MNEQVKSIKQTKTYSMLLIALFAAITAVFSQISIPIGPVPINLALLAVFTAAGLLNVKQAVASQAIYILMGIIGVPVFAGFRGGFAVIFGPTGGYILGYIAAAFLISLLLKKIGKKPVFIALAIILGLILCYTLGTIWFVLSSGTGVVAALSACVFPFLPGDACKIAVATILSVKLKKIV